MQPLDTTNPTTVNPSAILTMQVHLVIYLLILLPAPINSVKNFHHETNISHSNAYITNFHVMCSPNITTCYRHNIDYVLTMGAWSNRPNCWSVIIMSTNNCCNMVVARSETAACMLINVSKEYSQK